MGGKADTPSGQAPAGRSPRVLFEEGARPPLAGPAKAAPIGPAVLFGVPHAPAAKADRPRVLASGEVRRRIPCSAAGLGEIDGAAPAALVAQALRIVDGLNLDDHHFDDVVRFGAGLQAEHGRLAEQELALVGSPVLARGTRLGADLLGHLSDLDPDAVFSVRGGVLRAIGALVAGHEPARLFPALYPQVLALSHDLDALGPQIAEAAQSLRAVAGRHAALERGLAAHILAGRFVVRHVGALDLPDPERRAHFASQAEALDTRVASLEATRATIEVGRRTLDALARSVDALADAGRGLLNEELPAWHTAYSAALMAARLPVARPPGNRPDAVEALRALHARILRRFISKG